MNDQEKVIKGLEICYTIGETCENCPYYDLPVEQSCNDALCKDALKLLKEQKERINELEGKFVLQEARLNAIVLLKKHEPPKPPVHIHEEYPEHDWERTEDGRIDEFAFGVDYHNGPVCKRCQYSFCMHCNPDGWNKPCVIDEYECPNCKRNIIKGTKFCSECGQAVKWEQEEYEA